MCNPRFRGKLTLLFTIYYNALALYRSNHGALYKILLQERVDNNDRNGYEHDAGCLQYFGSGLNCTAGICQGRGLRFRCGRHQLIQFILNHFQVRTLGVVHVVCVGVPTAYSIEQSQRCQDRFGQRQHDPA